MRRSTAVFVSVGIMSALPGCATSQPADRAPDGEATTSPTVAVAQVGGTSPTDAAQLLVDALNAADCTRVREVSPGMLGEPGLCSEIVAGDESYTLKDANEKIDGDVAIVEASLIEEGSDRLQILAANTEVGWLLVGGPAEEGFFDEVPDLGADGMAIDAVRAYVAASRDEDCDAYVKAFPGGLSRDCIDMESLALDQVAAPSGEPQGPVVTAQVTFIDNDEPVTRETLLIRTVENRWMIAAFLT